MAFIGFDPIAIIKIPVNRIYRKYSKTKANEPGIDPVIFLQRSCNGDRHTLYVCVVR